MDGEMRDVRDVRDEEASAREVAGARTIGR